MFALKTPVSTRGASLVANAKVVKKAAAPKRASSGEFFFVVFGNWGPGEQKTRPSACERKSHVLSSARGAAQWRPPARLPPPDWGRLRHGAPLNRE